MCGIFGYVGAEQDAGSLVFQGLKELEYRGYDSWGIAIAHRGGVLCSKEVGKLPESGPLLPNSSAALGHTRWATTGGVTKSNAHPHLDSSGRFAVVHNGIAENYVDLRRALEEDGYEFDSETDTEVIAALIAKEIEESKLPLKSALLKVFRKLEGLNAVVVLDTQTLELAAAKSGSPLYVGLGTNSRFLSSDIAAFLAHAEHMIRLDDGQLVSLKGSEVKLMDVAHETELPIRSERVKWKREAAARGRYAHFLEKEIHEQPSIIRSMITEDAAGLSELRSLIDSAKRIWLSGCGTAYHAALTGGYLLHQSVPGMVSTVYAHELDRFVGKFSSEDLLIAFSQSGETIDVLEGAKAAKARGAKVAAFVNVPGASLTHLADVTVLLGAGPEKAVLSTKAYSAKLARLIELSLEREISSAVLARTATEMELLLGDRVRKTVRTVAERIKNAKSMFVLGAGLNYPLALEAALKIKEVSYIHAEGFACGELKHGVIALIERGTPCIIYSGGGADGERAMVSAGQVRARGAYIIGIGPENRPEFDVHIPVRRAGVEFSLAALIPAQLLAYELAIALNRDPDKPRNLAKSVTVR